MAITAVALTSWSDVASFLSGMKDETNTNFFTNVVYDTSANTISLYTTESGSDPMCILHLAGSAFTGLMSINIISGGTIVGSYAPPNYGVRFAPSSEVTFPFNGYKTPHGALINIGSQYPLGICKSSLGETTILTGGGNPLSSSQGYSYAPKTIGIYNTKMKYYSGYQAPTYSISSGTGGMNNMEFTALVPLPTFAEVPEYTQRAYMNFFTQTPNVYGSFEYQGHTYLTNGLISIYDT